MSMKWILVAMLVALSSHGREPVIAIAGSSAAQGYGNTDGRKIFGWGEVMQDFFVGTKVVNFAQGGWSTKMFLARGRWQELLEAKPDYILMNIGANDAKPGEGRYTDPNGEYKANLRRFAADAEKIGAEIIFVTLNQRLVFDKEGKVRAADRIPYTKAMKEVAAELGKDCIDLSGMHSALLESLGERNATYLFRIRDDGTLDRSHYSRPGAIRLAEMIASGLRRGTSDLKRYLR
jgi:lysophospholipase L1-like esterase